MRRPVILCGPRMDALAQRHADAFGDAERAKANVLENDPDVTADEMVSLLVRSAVAFLGSSITVAADQTGSHILEIRQTAVADLDANLADYLAAHPSRAATGCAGRA